jgi:hypothetical protein
MWILVTMWKAKYVVLSVYHTDFFTFEYNFQPDNLSTVSQTLNNRIVNSLSVSDVSINELPELLDLF